MGISENHLNFEQQLEKVGSFGRFQKVFLGVGASVLTICLALNISTVFTLEDRDFECRLTESNETLKNHCPCAGEIVFVSDDEPSLVSKYELVCDNEKHKHWARFSFALGLLLGSPINGFLADKYGRRGQICVCSVAVLVFGVLGPLMPTYFLYCLFRFLTSALGSAGYIIVSYVYMAETMNNRGRGYLGVIVIVAWSLGGGVTAFFGKYFRSFLLFDWACAIVFAVIGITITICAVESPRWRFSQNDEYKYFKDMMFIAKVNGKKLSDEDKDQIRTHAGTQQRRKEEHHHRETAQLRDLFVNKYTTCITLVLWFIWLAVSFACYSLVFHALIGDKVSNLLIGSVFETSVNLAMLLVIQRVPRKLLMFITAALASTCAISSALLLVLQLEDNYFYLYVFVTICCRLLGSVFWGLLGLVTTECYPTLLRAQANGVANITCRVSVVLVTVMGGVPQLYILSTVSVALLLLTFCIPMLPETLGKDLPTSVEEYAQFCKEGVFRIRAKRSSEDAIVNLNRVCSAEKI